VKENQIKIAEQETYRMLKQPSEDKLKDQGEPSAVEHTRAVMCVEMDLDGRRIRVEGERRSIMLEETFQQAGHGRCSAVERRGVPA